MLTLVHGEVGQAVPKPVLSGMTGSRSDTDLATTLILNMVESIADTVDLAVNTVLHCVIPGQTVAIAVKSK